MILEPGQIEFGLSILYDYQNNTFAISLIHVLKLALHCLGSNMNKFASLTFNCLNFHGYSLAGQPVNGGIIKWIGK